MAAKARLAELQGFAPDGLTIEDPEKYVDSVLTRLVNQVPRIGGLWRKNSPPTLMEYTGAADELTTLIDMVRKEDNKKQFVQVPAVGLRRLSASGESNCCWFDAFLQCMSKQYNNLPLNDRIEVRKRFRVWCNDHVEEIIAQIPRDVFPAGPADYLTDDQIRADLSDTEDEIDAQTGMFIAWYFGVNCIVVHKQAGEYLVECQNAYQSPECKTIVIYYENAHFEPMGKFDVAPNNKMTNAKFLFDWSDTDLCLLKNLSLACENIDPWTAPTCGGAAVVNTGNGATAAGNTAVNNVAAVAVAGNATRPVNRAGNNAVTGATPTGGTTPARAPMMAGRNTPANPAAETVRKQLRFANNVGRVNTPGGLQTNGGYIIGAGGGAAEQRGGKKRRTRKHRAIKRRSQTKKRRTSRK